MAGGMSKYNVRAEVLCLRTYHQDYGLWIAYAILYA